MWGPLDLGRKQIASRLESGAPCEALKLLVPKLPRVTLAQILLFKFHTLLYTYGISLSHLERFAETGIVSKYSICTHSSVSHNTL